MIPVRTKSVAGCQLLNQWIRGVDRACNQVSGELFWASLGFSFSILLFHASDVFGQEIQAFSSISSVRCAEVVGVRRGAESVIGNLLASGRTFRTRSARLSSACQGWACKAPILLFSLFVGSRSVGKPPDCVFKKMLSSTSLKWELVVRAVRDGDRRSARVGLSESWGGRAAVLATVREHFYRDCTLQCTAVGCRPCTRYVGPATKSKLSKIWQGAE